MSKICISEHNFNNLLKLALNNCESKNSQTYPRNIINFPVISPPFFSSLVIKIDTNYGNTIDLSYLKNNDIQTIDWGDNPNSFPNKLSTPVEYKHTYSAKQIYRIIINGNIENLNMFLPDPNNPQQPQPQPLITSIIQFPENCKSISLNYLTNLISVPTELPETAKDLSLCFANCQNFLGKTRGSNDVEGNIGTDWHVENVTNMKLMFAGCSLFNQDLSNWDVGNVTNMNSMFKGCRKFNNGDSPGLSNKPLNWNVEKVTDMNSMFYNCESFNQDISNWNISKVTDMSFMFFNCNSFKQDLSKWLYLLYNNNIYMSAPFGNNKRCFDIKNTWPQCTSSCNPGSTPSGSSPEICLLCQKGYYCPGGKDLGKSCPAGTYCPVGSSSPVNCPAGTYCPEDGSSSPVNCPAGTYSSAIGATSSTTCQKCPDGTYSSTDGSQCNRCPVGTFYGKDSSQCYPCPPGTYSNKDGSQCTFCQANYYCISGTQAPCPKGTYSSIGSKECVSCPNGICYQ